MSGAAQGSYWDSNICNSNQSKGFRVAFNFKYDVYSYKQDPNKGQLLINKISFKLNEAPRHT